MITDGDPLALKDELQELLPHMGADEVEALMEGVADAGMEILREPETGLLMMTARDCFGVSFHLGEVLVTEAEVVCAEARGHGRVLGDEPERALLMAAAEAVLLAGDPACCQRLGREVRSLRERIEPAMQTEKSMSAATRVRFDSMPGE